MSEEGRQMRVAVVGSGLAGLTASWMLTRDDPSEGAAPPADVELYESAPSLGMGTHSVELPKSRDGAQVFVDIPPRFVVPSYYTELLQLYKSIGIPFYLSSGDGCFQDLRGAVDEQADSPLKPYFRFGNFRLWKFSLPYVLVAPWSSTAMKIVWDLLRFRWRARKQLAAGELTGVTFGEYLDEQYSKEFGERFAVPVLCVVCTCSPAAVRAYPADTLVEYWLCWALRGEGLRRAEGGTKSVVSHLSAGLSHCHLGTRVTSLRDADQTKGEGQHRKWLVCDDKGVKREFDHVILATQAKHAASLIEDYCNSKQAGDTTTLQSLARAVRGVKSEAGEMVLHGDSAAMPEARSSWSAMNVFVSPDRSSVMCTAWQSRIEARGRESDFQHPSAQSSTPSQQRLPLLQTWNPQAMEQATGSTKPDGGASAKGKSAGTAQHKEGTLADELIISRAWFDRPVVTLETPGQLAVIKKAQGTSNLWIIGSYTLPGVPLLENAARSGLNVAETLRPGALRPWRERTDGQDQEIDVLTTAAAGGARPGYLNSGNCVIGAPGALADGSIAVISAVPIAVAVLGVLLAWLMTLLLDAATGSMGWNSILPTLKEAQQ